METSGKVKTYRQQAFYLLGYSQWRNLIKVIIKAKMACETAEDEVLYHLADVSKMVDIGAGSKRILSPPLKKAEGNKHPPPVLCTL